MMWIIFTSFELVSKPGFLRPIKRPLKCNGIHKEEEMKWIKHFMETSAANVLRLNSCCLRNKGGKLWRESPDVLCTTAHHLLEMYSTNAIIMNYGNDIAFFTKLPGLSSLEFAKALRPETLHCLKAYGKYVQCKGIIGGGAISIFQSTHSVWGMHKDVLRKNVALEATCLRDLPGVERGAFIPNSCLPLPRKWNTSYTT